MRCSCINCIVPPHILLRLVESDKKELRQIAMRTLLTTTRLRGQRSVRASLTLSNMGAAQRTVFDCRNSTNLSAARVARTEEGPASSDAAINRVFDGLGATRDFYKEVYKRDSIDGRGMRLNGFVHYDREYNNAFWDGSEMVFGDGDGMLFSDFTGSLDVIGHELTHGVTETRAGLVYHRQSGALNESVSDVFGSLVKQWSLNQSAEDADWLIGADIFTPAIAGDALRSLKNPGSAYDNDIFGKDPQPDHMSRYDDLPDTEEGDFGGVHINSGIPNKAFYLVATEIGGYAWEAPGHIWYESLRASSPTTDFRGFAELTFMMADRLYGTGSREQQAVASAWQEVGVRIAPVVARMETPPRARRGNGQTQREEDSLAALSRQVAALAEQVSALSREVNGAKSRRVSARN